MMPMSILTAPVARGASSVRLAVRLAAPVVAFVVAGTAAVVLGRHAEPRDFLLLGGGVVGIGIGGWMFLSEQIEKPLLVLLLYLGLLDGFLKLRINSSATTLIRDAFLYAILLGYLARTVIRRETLRLPPLTGWVLTYVLLVLVQLFNPADVGVTHTLGALRPDLEFVPLFFVGYAVLQTRGRLRAFFVIMLVIAVANGVVGAVQLNLTPSQLASWGPGYAFRINGTGSGLNHISARTFTTPTGQVRTRPFGLGDDVGIGEAWGMLALGAALALMSLGARDRAGRWALLLCLGPPLAIITGESRALLVGSVAAIIAYIALATTLKRIAPTLAAVGLGVLAIVGVVLFISAISGPGTFSRYATISPGHLTSETSQDRGSSYSEIPRLIRQHPLGNGLGSSGPASNFAGASGSTSGSNAETEPTYLLSELGIPGLIFYYAFNLNLLLLAIARIRRLDPEIRSLVAGLIAGLVALLVIGTGAATTSISPYSPYFWLTAGALSYWLTTGTRNGQAAALDETLPLSPNSARGPNEIAQHP